MSELAGAALPRRELRRVPRLPPWARDVVPALAVAIVQVGGVTVAGHHQPDARPMTALGVLLLAAGPAALAFRRVAPVAVLAVTFAATMAYWLTDLPRGPAFLALLVAYVNAVMRGHRRAAWASLGLGFVVVGLVSPLVHHDPWPPWGAAAALAAWLAALGAGTELVRARQQRAAEEAAARAEEARRQASEERLRIAQELHDVLAHNISLINVQASVALHLLDEHPEQARPALTTIKDASHDALGELRTALDLLRSGADAPLVPAPSLAQLGTLVDGVRAGGLDVRLDPGVPRAPVPVTVELAAYRIVQEALTNVTRHAHAHSAKVTLTYDTDELRVEVVDDGVGGVGSPGNGVAGMRERAESLGGTLEAGPRAGGGFRIAARLPTGSP